MAKSPLPEQVRQTCRLKHFSLKTEKAYLTWIKRFILFNNKRHPSGQVPDIQYFPIKASISYRHIGTKSSRIWPAISAKNPAPRTQSPAPLA